METRGLGQDELTSIIRRVMAENRAYIDPFTLMEFITVVRPIICRDLEEVMSDEHGSFTLESARLTLARLFRRLRMEDPDKKAMKVTTEILREINKNAVCSG